MLVGCEKCGHRLGKPGASGCLVYSIRLAVPLLTLAVMAPWAAREIHLRPSANSWPYLLAMSLVIVFMVFYFWFTEYALKLRHSRVNCPQCGGRNWSKGFYSGFGI